MYKCKYCSKKYEKFQSLGGHVIHCKQNPRYDDIKKENIKKLHNWQQKKFVKKHGKLISKKKICHNCDQKFLLDEYEYDKKKKYFCSKFCAHSYCTKDKREEINKKVSKSLLGKKYALRIIRSCPICKKKFKIIESSKVKTCGKRKCVNILIGKNVTGKTGGYRTKSGRSKIHGGYYKNIWMDSSWELRLAKLLDKEGIVWERGSKYKFPYKTKTGLDRNYYPDFYLPKEDLFIEIKGYWTTEIRHKVDDSLRRNNFKLLILESIDAIDSVVDMI